jgi:hypothetical protein
MEAYVNARTVQDWVIPHIMYRGWKVEFKGFEDRETAHEFIHLVRVLMERASEDGTIMDYQEIPPPP